MQLTCLFCNEKTFIFRKEELNCLEKIQDELPKDVSLSKGVSGGYSMASCPYKRRRKCHRKTFKNLWRTVCPQLTSRACLAWENVEFEWAWLGIHCVCVGMVEERELVVDQYWVFCYCQRHVWSYNYTIHSCVLSGWGLGIIYSYL